MRIYRTIQTFLAALVACLMIATSSQAQVASAFVREDETINQDIVSSISNTAVNRVGGYSATINLEDPDTGDLISTIYGNATAGAPGIMRQEGTFGDLTQTSFESFFGMDDAGVASYSPSSSSASTGITGLDGIWLGDNVIQNERDPVADAPGEFSSFNSRPGVTADGVPYWVGGLTDTKGGGSNDRALFYDGNILLRGGDNIGVAEPVTTGSGIDFDYRFSALGTNYISPIDVASSSTNDIVMVMNGTAMMEGGTVVREGTLMPMSVGGNGVENWDNFDFMGVNEAGDYLFTGDTDNADTGADEFVFMNGSVVLREGDLVDGLALNGSIEGGFMNEQGDWAVIWDVDTPGGNVEALIINGSLALMEGDLVDWNGDGVVDGSDNGFAITSFTGISSLTLSDRINGSIFAYFTADAEDLTGAELEAAFGYRVVIPEPSSSCLLWLAALVYGSARRKNR